MKLTVEGGARFYADVREKISKEMDVFYNPAMSFNRDVTIRILSSAWLSPVRALRIGLPMAGSGVRGLRILAEVPDRVSSVHFNDIDAGAVSAITRSLSLSPSMQEKSVVTQMDANHFLMGECGFDYVDIDPFGSPNPFLDSAVRRIARGGILAVTATDTAGPCGTFPKVGMRKYWGKPLKTEHMHEIGLRLLIRKVQLVGMQYDRGLEPIFCFYRDHYFRAIFLAKKAKAAADSIAQKMGFLLYCRKCGSHETTMDIFNGPECGCGGKWEFAGPLFLGPLFDRKLAREICAGETGTLGTIGEEAMLDFPFFYEIGAISKANKIPQMKKRSEIIRCLVKAGFSAGPTHFNPNAIKTDADLQGLLRALR